MDIGLSGHLHLDVHFDQNKYHLKDVISGYFCYRDLKIKVKHMELCINKKEITTGIGIHENKIITRLEIMDGEPVIGEKVPIRLFLSSIDGLTPS